MISQFVFVLKIQIKQSVSLSQNIGCLVLKWIGSDTQLAKSVSVVLQATISIGQGTIHKSNVTQWVATLGED